jgi:hypothetical protein
MTFASSEPAPAGEPSSGTQIAAVDPNPRQISPRTARPTLEREAEVAQLLAQLEPQPVKREGAAGTDVLLVELASDLPPGAAESVAQEFGLELVGRMDFPSLDLRLHRYRVRDGNAVGDVLSRLRQDPRVRSAQTTVVYRLPEPEKPPVPATPPTTAPAQQQAKAPASLLRPSKRSVAAVKAAPRKSAASDPAPALAVRPERPPASVTQTALRFPTADEPFVNRGGR